MFNGALPRLPFGLLISHPIALSGEPVTVERSHAADYLPCPCGAEKHARLSFLNIRQMCRANPHSSPDDDSHYPDVKPTSKSHSDLPKPAPINAEMLTSTAGPSNVPADSKVVEACTIPENRLEETVISGAAPAPVLDDPIHSLPHPPDPVSALPAPTDDGERPYSSLFDTSTMGTTISPSDTDAPLDMETMAVDLPLEEADYDNDYEEDPEEDESGFLQKRPPLLTPDKIVKKSR
ncbi:hypothetical protein C0995_004204 [Termitomyces sp. Mi166|nr:hypothetical protein C0995_004204 [Termitomyces sp. Mi166\